MAFLWKVTRSLRRLSAEDTGLYGFADCVDDDGGGHIRVRHTRTRLLLQALLVTVLLVGVGVTGVFADNALYPEGREQVRTVARLSREAQAIYESLTIADKSATGHLLVGSKPPETLWRRYDNASDQVAKRLVGVANLMGGDTSRATDIANIVLRFPFYTNMMGEARGLVDGARKTIALMKAEKADSKKEKSAVGQALLGAAYMRQASFYLQKELLPAVVKFRDHETDNLRDAEGTDFWTWVIHLPLLLAGLAGLAWIQWSLAHRTHRSLNCGLLGATVLMVVMLGMTALSLWDWSEAENGFVEIGRELTRQGELIDTEGKMLDASADINLLLGGASPLTLNEFKSRFEKNIYCFKQKSLCDAYSDFIYEPMNKGKSGRAATAALPGGKFAQKFDAANESNFEEIKTRAGRIELRVGKVSLPSLIGLPIALLCSCAVVCAVVCAGLGFWIRIKEYL